jgi:hypothetical protein
MRVDEMYKAFDALGLDYEVIEIFDGARILNISVDEVTEDELHKESIIDLLNQAHNQLQDLQLLVDDKDAKAILSKIYDLQEEIGRLIHKPQGGI